MFYSRTKTTIFFVKKASGILPEAFFLIVKPYKGQQQNYLRALFDVVFLLAIFAVDNIASVLVKRAVT